MNITRNHTLRMTKTELQRKARAFRAALAAAGTTAEGWAAAQDITAGHLSQVLSGKRESRVLMDKIEAFTKRNVKVKV